MRPHAPFTLILPLPLHAFFFYSSGDHRDLHSFPTRRSSDLSSRNRLPATAPGVKGGRSFFANALAATETRISSGLRLPLRSEEHTSELQSRRDLVCRLLLEKKKKNDNIAHISSLAKACGLHS